MYHGISQTQYDIEIIIDNLTWDEACKKEIEFISLYGRSDKQKGIAKPIGFGDKVAERMKKEFSVNNPNRRPDLQKICEHCDKTVGPSNYARWHGDNCKQK